MFCINTHIYIKVIQFGTRPFQQKGFKNYNNNKSKYEGEKSLRVLKSAESRILLMEHIYPPPLFLIIFMLILGQDRLDGGYVCPDGLRKRFSQSTAGLERNSRTIYLNCEVVVFLVAKLLYNYLCPSVCPSVRLRGKRDFLGP